MALDYSEYQQRLMEVITTLQHPTDETSEELNLTEQIGCIFLVSSNNSLLILILVRKQSLPSLLSLTLSSAQYDANVMLDAYITTAARSEWPRVREAALRCLALVCLQEEDLARAYAPFLFQVFEQDTERVRVTALQTLFDLAALFGLDIVRDALDEFNSNGSTNVRLCVNTFCLTHS